MGTVRIVMNVDGYNAYRNSDSVTAAVEAVGADLAARFNAAVARDSAGGHVLPGKPGSHDVYQNTAHSASRVEVYVGTGSFRARVAEARYRLLLAALGGSA